MGEARGAALVASLTSSRSRRAVLGLLSGSLGVVGVRAATAKKKKRFCKCAVGYHCDKGQCIPDVPTAPPVAR